MYRNDSNIPLTMAVWLAADYGYDLKYDPMVYSATDLLKPMKSLILSREIRNKALPKETTDISDLAPARLGTAAHAAIEDAWKNDYASALRDLGYPDAMISRVRINPKVPQVENVNIFIEQRASVKVHVGSTEYTLSGQFDFVVDGRVRDVKTTKVYTWINGSNNHKFMMQGSIYKFLNQDIITDDFMSIDYAFTDWSPLQAKANRDYPPSRILSKDLELLPIDVTGHFIQEKFNTIDDLIGKSQAEMPECTPDELWQNPAKWAFYKKRTNKKATKLYDNAADANTANADIGNTGVVVHRPSTPKFCTYCDASSICLQADAFRAAGLL